MISRSSSWRQYKCNILQKVSHNVTNTSKHVNDIENTPWRQKICHEVKNMSWHRQMCYDVKNTSWRQQMCQKSSSWCQKHTMTSKSSSTTWHDNIRFVMTSNVYHKINNISQWQWHQKHVFIIFCAQNDEIKKCQDNVSRSWNTSWQQKIRLQVKNTPWR